jgi:hypothetical protein
MSVSSSAPVASASAAPKDGRRSCTDLGAEKRAAGDRGADPAPPEFDAVVASLRPRFTACYREGLRTDAGMEGCVVIRAMVAADGTVAASKIFVREGLPSGVVGCIHGVVRDATFKPTGKPVVVLDVPVTFTQ